MTTVSTTETDQQFPPMPERYERMNRANGESFYMTDINRPFDVYMTHATASTNSEPRREYWVNRDEKGQPIHTEETLALKAINKANRYDAAGNMSVKNNLGPLDLTVEERIVAAEENMIAAITNLGINPGEVHILNPLRPVQGEYEDMKALNIDDDPLDPNATLPTAVTKSSDFIYTYNPDTVLGVRPADCPLVIASAETPKGRVYIMVHFAWRGAVEEGNGVQDMFAQFKELGVDQSTLQIYVTPGGHAESFPFKNKKRPHDQYPNLPGVDSLFRDVTGDEENGYQYGIDTPNHVYEGLLDAGLNEKQIFIDTSDTSALESGYSSHGRSMRLDEDNNRDIVIVTFNSEKRVKINPERMAPPEILRQIVPIDVEYFDFNGERQNGTIEVNEAIAADVADFFALALSINFPIENVVRSSDPEYGWDDEKLMAANTTSGFNYRYIKGTTKPSLHGEGLAFDVNTFLNPYYRYDDETGGLLGVDPIGAVYNPNIPGTLTADHPLVLLMKERGFEWGGDWTPDSGRTDIQHFQKRIDTESV